MLDSNAIIMNVDKQDSVNQVDSNANIIEEEAGSSGRVVLLKWMNKYLRRKKDTTPVWAVKH